MPGRPLAIADRVVTLYEHGGADGPVILYHHGTPAAGGPPPHVAQDAIDRGARLLAYDRPGYGDSTPHPGRAVGDAASDCKAILDALGIERAVVWGISGGGPHALACAALIADRVSAAAVLGSVTPFDAPGLNYFRGMGDDNLIELGLAMAGRDHIAPFAEHEAAELVAATPEEITGAMASLVQGPDREVLAHGAAGHHWAATMPVSFAHGPDGWIDDDLAFVRPFGFLPSDIRVPVLVVHGRQDRFVPVAHGEWLAGAIPGAEAWIEDEEAHFTLLERRVPEVHAWLLERAR
jgi:pimeloyl-ACP methyl ester carboxylesterase